jgi:hypothetical protein
MRPKLLLPACVVVLAACAPKTPKNGSTIVIADPSNTVIDSVGPSPGPCSRLVIVFVPGMTQDQFKAALVTALASCKG